jgi:beta-fructofuranosidase
MNHAEILQKATLSMKNSINQANNCPYRPTFHFIPPAQWMNDPNGTIYYKGEFHLFYQFNPYGDRWGNMHWGHAKSVDLIRWEHLPIALAPLKEKGESHVFSGCCIVGADDTPTIFYTSIRNLRAVLKGAEQWAAISRDGMQTWSRVDDNPRLSDQIHKGKIRGVLNWRDPYIFKIGGSNLWYMVLGSEKLTWKLWDLKGAVLLYSSSNLRDWKYEGELIETPKKVATIAECPNFIPFGSKFLLIISALFNRRVKFAIGDFENKKFRLNPGSNWMYLDLGKKFYATNTFFDEKGDCILIAWIKGGGTGGWNGMMSLPRILSLKKENILIQRPIPQIQDLRSNLKEYKNLMLKSNNPIDIQNPGVACIEIALTVKFKEKPPNNNGKTGSWGIQLEDGQQTFPLTIFRSSLNYTIQCIDQTGILTVTIDQSDLQLQIFVDHSVIEVFINNRDVITARFFPVFESNIIAPLKISMVCQNLDVEIPSMQLWDLEKENL